MIVDTHAHLNFNAYKDDVDAVVRRSLDSDVWMINVGSQLSTSKRAVELSEKYQEGVYAAVGLHPIHAQDGFDYEKYKELAKSEKLVAIGEIGLDYKEEYVSFKEKQKEIFLKQLGLAKELNLPVIFHCRMAHQDLLDNLNIKVKGVVHCFSGNWQEAEKYLDKGLYLGFNGIIFKLDLDEVIEKTPEDRILIETDCPYLTPPPMKGRNEPIYVRYVAEKIAKIKNINMQKISLQTTQNAKDLFAIS